MELTLIKNLLFCSLVVFGIQRQAAAQVSDIGTILPGSQLTFRQEVVVRADSERVKIGNRTAVDSDGETHYLVASCEIYPQGGPVGYDRKITADRTLTITAVRQDNDPRRETVLQLGTTGYIKCFGWGQQRITIDRFRSILSDLDIRLEQRVPEL